VRPAHRAAQRPAAHAARPRVRNAHQEAAGIGQEPDAQAAATAATTTAVVFDIWRSGHQRAGRVRRRIVFFCRLLIYVVTMIIL